mmetsp:Transcript_24328/g.41887  ORF Transcript_24328/g.41887 Transcript_24328/m.41887 type:complete len:298 (+) Transcript_24328:1804-2697(+)
MRGEMKQCRGDGTLGHQLHELGIIARPEEGHEALHDSVAIIHLDSFLQGPKGTSEDRLPTHVGIEHQIAHGANGDNLRLCGGGLAEKLVQSGQHGLALDHFVSRRVKLREVVEDLGAKHGDVRTAYLGEVCNGANQALLQHEVDGGVVQQVVETDDTQKLSKGVHTLHHTNHQQSVNTAVRRDRQLGVGVARQVADGLGAADVGDFFQRVGEFSNDAHDALLDHAHLHTHLAGEIGEGHQAALLGRFVVQLRESLQGSNGTHLAQSHSAGLVVGERRQHGTAELLGGLVAGFSRAGH